MSPPTSPTSSTQSSLTSDSSSYMKKRRRSSSSSLDNDERSSLRGHPQFSPLVALPPPMVSYSAPQQISPAPPPPPGVAYYPIYTSHNGHFFIASPPLDPTSSNNPKLLPKLANHQHPQAPPTPTTLPSSPVSTPYAFYHPYQLSPPIQPTYQHPPVHSQANPSTANLSTAHQREQARKVSHSAIERRRRERINDKIMQLKQLIPTCAGQENLHKMSILQSSIDYITYLKEVLQQVNEQQQEGTDDRPIKTLDLSKLHKIKTPKSMVPKEVEPFTSQFNANQSVSSRPVTPPIQEENQQKCLKPMDIIMSGAKKQQSPTTDLPTPALTPTALPTKNMSVKDLLC
ncbi:hypothetical protein [Absidia glauca]|uniref:BHLH domain-containing protein n=1 Tax=Absidia glauca TaxID=4829 RepID=A0A163K0W6_ABSGL|nr:hypothetical protein [Absidia glauca]